VRLFLQGRHALTQLRQSDQPFLISGDQPLAVLLNPCLFPSQFFLSFSQRVRVSRGCLTALLIVVEQAEDVLFRESFAATEEVKLDSEGQAGDFTKVAQDSKVITEATVNATAVQSMTRDTATVLIAVTTRVSNVASKEQAPRSWRLSVDVARDGGQIKLAKVEFVP